MTPQITTEQKSAVETHNGLVTLDGGDQKYVLMRLDVYQKMMGIESDEEYQATVAAIQEGLDDFAAGRFQSLEEFVKEFDRDHGISR